MTARNKRNDGRREMEGAVAEFAERLPEVLKPLARLAFNYRWSWAADGVGIFRDIDPAGWRRSGCNPRYMLEATPPRRFQELAGGAGYVERVQQAASRLEEELAQAPLPGIATPDEPIAYFCSEFGVHCSLPIYGGGLGVLAGDTLKAASDLALPMVGIGLLYRQGYFHQRFDLSGWQHEYWVNTDFDRLPAVRVAGADGRPLSVEVIVRGRVVRVQAWRIDVGRVPLFLLDTESEENHPIDRWITARLYNGDRHIRLAQYAILGIGGRRMLEAMGITPRLCHLNEGHAALSAVESARALALGGRSFEEALNEARQRFVFTTHTPVPAGNEGYSPEELEPVLGDFIASLQVPRRVFYDLGRVTQGNEGEPVSITPLALRASRAANGVSQLHGKVAREMWRPLWPDRVAAEVPIGAVTNGVHALTWMSSLMQALIDRYVGPEWRGRVDDTALWAALDAIPDQELWETRCALRNKLVAYVREQSIRDRIGRGEAPSYVEAAARMFDPNVLTIGFARRAATYKRLYLLTRFPDRGIPLLSNQKNPVQVIAAGKAHPADNDAKETLRNLFQVRFTEAISQRAVFAEDYDLHMAPRIVSGVDLWLNLPRPPLEASGTSGMKVTLNGGLNLSVLDGWWAEAYDGENGWAIQSPDADPAAQDDHDAHALFDLLEREVIPLFYERDGSGIPRRWIKKVKYAMRTLIPRFSARRMLRDYVQRVYAG